MFRILVFASFALVVVPMSAACDADSPATLEQTAEETPVADTAEVTLEVDGMDCVNCAAAIEEKFDETDGVLTGDVDFGAGTADVEYDPEVFDEADIVDLVEDEDFEAAVGDES